MPRPPSAYVIRYPDRSWQYITVRSDRTVHYESSTARIPNACRSWVADVIWGARVIEGTTITRRG